MLSDAAAGRPRPPAPQRGRAPQMNWRRSAPAPRRAVVDVCAALAGVGLGLVVASVVMNETRGSLAAPGGQLTALGRLAAFTGAYLLLVMVVLAARLPWLERAVGQDQLIRWHRSVAPSAIALICLHVVATTLGYAQADSSPLLHELWVLITSYRDILAAVVGFGLLIVAAISSYRAIRRRLRYETWWAIHLYLYLALALAFAHQIFTGLSFIAHPLTKALWITVWLATAGMVIVFRIGQPVWRSLRHQLRVVEVRDETPGVVSIICQGRQLEHLPVSGGQFFMWRFLTRGLWWQAHPYSLSALPRPPYLRFTIKATGDASRAMAALRPGTRVAIEGPYGAFTHHARLTDGVLLVGAGVGITPLRALLEDLPKSTDVVVVIRASRSADLVHRAEIAALVQHRGGRLHELVGSRHRVRLTARTLHRLVPD
ncbi:MAG: ferric reductase-like transmembrane domain-containing protein, partial [Actinobacteria bacterium]|nr:ferric reductase-like transmembrane domain-containing protein [Actinomycetota bacterium]